MARPLFEGPELREVTRFLGALLMIVSGVIMLFQTFSSNILPPTDGFLETSATVLSLKRIGSFRDPAFLVSLKYKVIKSDGTIEEIRSSRRVDFELYYDLAEGDEMLIHYNPHDLFEWRMLKTENQLSRYALGLVMLIIGISSLILPIIIRWGSRQEDFELTDERDNKSLIGAEP